jgi:SWI/SNF-related matrix-associated actin-dependent regulator 1 of chromatin subfamily A
MSALPYRPFVGRYCISWWNGKREVIVGNQNVAELRQLLTPFMMRRTKAEVLPDLPPITFSDFVVEPGEVDLEVHFADRDAVKELHIVRKEIEQQSALIQATGGMTEYKNRLGALEGLVKSTSTLRRYMGVQKAIPLAELVAGELKDGAYEKIVIFCMHRAVIEELRYRLKKFNPVTLYGGTSPATRQSNIDKFQKDKKCKVFIGQVQAAGTAINLTAAHHVLFAEYDWVPANNAQAAMRCHRIGQTQPVFVRFAVAAGVIDEVVLKVVRRKSKELAQIFDPVDIFA